MGNFTNIAIKQKNRKPPHIQQVLIIGASGHAKVIIDIFEKNKWEVVGLIDDNLNISEVILGYKVLGKVDEIPQIIQKIKTNNIFVAIGDNWIRQQIINKIKVKTSNIEFVNAIHPSAQIGKNVTLGKGIAIMAGTIVNAESIIGDFAFINTNASAGHDTKMSNYSSLAPGVTLGGNTQIGEFSAISIGATIIEGIIIGKHCIIGAAALLLTNCEDNWIMYGVPAKKIRTREAGEKYYKNTRE